MHHILITNVVQPTKPPHVQSGHGSTTVVIGTSVVSVDPQSLTHSASVKKLLVFPYRY